MSVQVCEQVRADPALRGVRILLLTAWLEGCLPERARQMGADDCLAKPFSPARLLEKVAALASTQPREPAGAGREETPPG